MSRIKECIVSRWGDDGYIVEVDYSQLEVIGLAFLSNDAVLKADILSGVDMHCMNASFLYGEEYDTIVAAYKAGDPTWTKRRKISKAPGFLIQYGGGAKTMAAQTGLSVAQCQGFIDNYYNRYVGVQEWQESVAEEVQKSRTPSSRKTAKGVPSMQGEYVSITGRRYRFFEYDSPAFKAKRGILTGFSPTQMKNYPVQGFATADVVPTMVGKLHYAIKSSGIGDKVKLINTVHDSIIMDVHKEALSRACTSTKKILEAAPDILQKVYGIKFDLPLKVDVEYGKNWKELKTYEE
jgi:DNA polymerase I-like protein with 3'-5' exonuclease and polymerase domains